VSKREGWELAAISISMTLMLYGSVVIKPVYTFCALPFAFAVVISQQLRLRVDRKTAAYQCPVCDNSMQDPPKDYNICPTCGVEFENDDENYTIEALRKGWTETHKRFFMKDWD
jgi:predicted RNA-binding Zn-ribbon protein involved in translation (DUF1610 family)